MKQRSSYYNILDAISNLLGVTNTTQDPTDSILKYIIPVCSDNLKDAFIHMGGNISNFTDLKKQKSELKVLRKWGKDTIEEGARQIVQPRGAPSMEQGW